jgi:hypothetical protein
MPSPDPPAWKLALVALGIAIALAPMAWVAMSVGVLTTLRDVEAELPAARAELG